MYGRKPPEGTRNPSMDAMIEGRAEFERRDVVEAKWSWWYLYWHPDQEDRFWFPRGEEHPEWTIINVHPESARLVKR